MAVRMMRGIAVPKKINKKWVRTERTRDSLGIKTPFGGQPLAAAERDIAPAIFRSDKEKSSVVE
jgi:hypothetical protein